LGPDLKRLNFVARIKGSGKGKPILLMAHSDVVPADRSQWTVDPFSAISRDGFIYGRGSEDDKSLLAAELAVMVEVKRRNINLGRDLILLAESDEESGFTGMQWMIQHQYPKIDAEFALNEGGDVIDTRDGPKIFKVQTTEKIPMHVIVTAKGIAGHASLPRPDNPVTHLSRALLKLAGADQPVHLTTTTRLYFRDLAKFSEYSWLDPLRRKLDDPATAQSAAKQIRARDPELDAMLRATVVPTTLQAGVKVNVIPNTASAEVDVRRMPGESRDDVLARLRQIVNDGAVDVELAPGEQMPPAGASSTLTPLYRAMERAVAHMYPKGVVTPYMSLGATDGSFLRARGMAVYGVPIFLTAPGENRAHGNDERISPSNIEDGVELLWQVVLETAGGA
ncbi:MAG: M20/M25/M40 family metallo-hydrolase, partial [Bryobacteraceae bacterium]